MDDSDYGLWVVAAINAAIFIVFALSFFKPRLGRDWRAMGAFTAFVVALFTGMGSRSRSICCQAGSATAIPSSR